MYASYNYYESGYLMGRDPKLSEDDFPFWEKQAERVLNQYTFSRLASNLGLITDEVKDCACELAELLYTNIISRFEEVQKFFENFSTEENESVKECEQRVIERIDYLVGADTGSTFFSVLGPFSPMNNGKLFVEVCMDALRDVIDKEFDVRIKKTQSRVNKYTLKYQKHRPNYTKKRRHG